MAVARILGAWGVRGDLKAEPLADLGLFQPGLALTLDGAAVSIERVTASGRQLRLKLAGIDGRDAAASHRGSYLLIAESDLRPAGEDRYYRFQLIGLKVVSSDGEEIGEIADVFSTGSNDVFVVRGPRGEALVPAIDDVVQSIDLEAGLVTIEVIRGLLPD